MDTETKAALAAWVEEDGAVAVADALLVSVDTVSRWLTQSVKPRRTALHALQTALRRRKAKAGRSAS